MSLTLVLLGITSGILSGLLGIGGGVIVIPTLVYFLGFSQKMAQGTALAAMIPPIGLLATMAYWQRGEVNLKASIFIALVFFLGGWLGGFYAQQVSNLILRRSFALLLLLTAINLWFNKQ